MSKVSKKKAKDADATGGGMKKRFFIAFVVVVLAISVFAVWGDKGIIDVYDLKEERDHIASEIAVLEEENKRLSTEVKLLESDKRYIETVARRDLGMIGPGEVIYKIDSGR
jgi:cell division protein FtsB